MPIPEVVGLVRVVDMRTRASLRHQRQGTHLHNSEFGFLISLCVDSGQSARMDAQENGKLLISV